MPSYDELPRSIKRAGKKLAKDLLRSTPPAKTPLYSCSPVGALATAYMKSERVEAVLIYSNDEDQWWGDVVFRKRNGTFASIGTSVDEPDETHDEALNRVKRIIASSKLNWEHPFVAELRAGGEDPEELSFMKVQTQHAGLRLVPILEDVTPLAADVFMNNYRDELSGFDLVDEAKAIVFAHVNRLANKRSDFVRISPPETAFFAASFLWCNDHGKIVEEPSIAQAA